jgi:hypothetical protein
MMSDSRLIRDIEEKLKDLNLDAEEEMKRRRSMYRALGLEQTGYTSKDLELPEGAILVGVSMGELKQAIARGGQLWVDGESFTAISTAAAKATGRRTQSGWEFWTLAYLPGKGFIELGSIRLSEPRVNNKRK